VQDQRDRHRRFDRGQPIQVERHGGGGETVYVADGDGEGVDPGPFHELSRLSWIGHRLSWGSVGGHVFVAGDGAELGFDPGAGRVGERHRGSGEFDVVLVGQV
jgi:hypothetical protein